VREEWGGKEAKFCPPAFKELPPPVKAVKSVCVCVCLLFAYTCYSTSISVRLLRISQLSVCKVSDKMSIGQSMSPT